MQGLSDATLLGIWERGRDRSAVARALLLLGAALPLEDAEHHAAIKVHERDSMILRLRRATFGPHLAAGVTCSRCGERLEFELDIENLLADASAPLEEEIRLGDGFRFRLPDSRDLGAVEDCQDAETAARRLVALCCVSDGAARPLPQELVPRLETELAARMSAAEIELKFACPGCADSWADYLDIGAFFWEEIERHAQRLLDEVHRLAGVYGWSEQDILAMSSERRAAYLERCDA